MYWLARRMRYAFLPFAALAGELYGVWLIGLGIAVLAAELWNRATNCGRTNHREHQDRP